MKHINKSKTLTYNLTWKGLTITKQAAKYVKELMVLDQTIKGLRIGIKNSGCAGFSYIVELTNKLLEDDLKFFSNNLLIFVSKKVIPLIDGTEIDYVKEGLNQKFVFKNPKAQHICGCGTSFSSR